MMVLVATERLWHWLRGRCTAVGAHRRRDTGELIDVVCERYRHSRWERHGWLGDEW